MLMLNYLGKPRDVMTLAHELATACTRSSPPVRASFLASTPLTLAENRLRPSARCSHSRKLLSEAPSQTERKVLLAGKVEDMINTVVRQIAFYDFECKLHEAPAAPAN